MNTETCPQAASAHPNVDESVAADNTLARDALSRSRNRPEALEWLRDAGMGLFIHWSLDVQLGCVISHSLVGASEEYVTRFYEELPKTLHPRRWDFDHLAELAGLAGFRYAVLTTKHHNGFCLWDTETTDFSIKNTPYGADLVRQYTEAFRRQGIKIGFYFSPEDFRYLRSRGLPITRTPKAPYTEEILEGYKDLLAAQMTEFLTRFGPVDVLFFDGGETIAGADGISLRQHCMDIAWDLQPQVLITRGAIPTPEQQLPGVGADAAWEGCMTLGTAWQYQPTNECYKTGRHLIRLLAETRAKGGSLLLNIAPDADGELCREQEGLLRELALWHFINGEAMHDVRPWILTNEEDTWLLQKKDGSALYAVLLGMGEWQRGQRRELLLKSVKAGTDTAVEVLGQSGEETEYRPDLDARACWEQREEGLFLSVMQAQRIYCGISWPNPLVLKITNFSPAFVPMGVQTLQEVRRESCSAICAADAKSREESCSGDPSADMESLREGGSSDPPADMESLRESGSSDLPAEAENVPESGCAILAARVETLGSFEEAELWFEWRVYPGFALSSYQEGWQKLRAGKVRKPGRYEAELSGLSAGVTYQYRAALGNERNVMKGELRLMTM